MATLEERIQNLIQEVNPMGSGVMSDQDVERVMDATPELSGSMPSSPMQPLVDLGFGEEVNIILNNPSESEISMQAQQRIINELEASMVLYYTGTSRDSETIINSQIKSMEAESSRSHKSINAMHQIKKSAYKTKELLLKGDIDGIAKELKFSWKSKKATSSLITNTKIQVLEDALMNAGARSVKISGAGGGGFMIIFIEPKSRFLIHEVLNKFDGEIKRFQFTGKGSTTWTI